VSDKSDHPTKGIETRFRDFSADVRGERLVRYVVHQIETGRHVEDVLKDSHVAEHFDVDLAASVLEHPEVIKAIQEQIRGQFAGYGGSVGVPEASGGGQETAGAE
jgi:hypothetical protein